MKARYGLPIHAFYVARSPLRLPKEVDAASLLATPESNRSALDAGGTCAATTVIDCSVSRPTTGVVHNGPRRCFLSRALPCCLPVGKWYRPHFVSLPSRLTNQ